MTGNKWLREAGGPRFKGWYYNKEQDCWFSCKKDDQGVPLGKIVKEAVGCWKAYIGNKEFGPFFSCYEIMRRVIRELPEEKKEEPKIIRRRRPKAGLDKSE